MLQFFGENEKGKEEIRA